MDFVVVGFGFGALGVLLGLALRDGGTRWWRTRADRPLPRSDVARRVARGRAGRAGGRLVAIAGGATCVATVVALAAGIDDRAGAAVVVTVLTLGFAVALAWAASYAHRYHPRPARTRALAPATRGPAPRATIDRGPLARPVGTPPPIAESAVGAAEPTHPVSPSAPTAEAPCATPGGAATAIDPDRIEDGAAQDPAGSFDPSIVAASTEDIGTVVASQKAPAPGTVVSPAEAAPGAAEAEPTEAISADADAADPAEAPATAIHAPPWRPERETATERPNPRALAHAGKTD